MTRSPDLRMPLDGRYCQWTRRPRRRRRSTPPGGLLAPPTVIFTGAVPIQPQPRCGGPAPTFSSLQAARSALGSDSIVGACVLTHTVPADEVLGILEWLLTHRLSVPTIALTRAAATCDEAADLGLPSRPCRDEAESRLEIERFSKSVQEEHGRRAEVVGICGDVAGLGGRERDVLMLLDMDAKPQSLHHLMGLGAGTVKSLAQQIREKLRTSSLAQARQVLRTFDVRLHTKVSDSSS